MEWTIIDTHIKWDKIAEIEESTQKRFKCETKTLDEGNGYYSLLIPSYVISEIQKRLGVSLI